MDGNGSEAGPQGLDRALTALALLTEGPRSISEVAREINVHRSTALRVLRTLEERGFARRQDDLRYRAGSMLISLGQQALEQMDLRSVAAPYLQKLHNKTKETVHLAVLEANEIVYIDKIDGQAAVRMWSRVGKRGSVHCHGIGKAAVAFLPESDLEAVADRIAYTKHTSTTITSRDEFLEEMRAIRVRGWATDDGEYEEIVHCIAAPVFQSDGELAAVSLASPVKSMEEMTKFLPDLLATATAISEERGAVTRARS